MLKLDKEEVESLKKELARLIVLFPSYGRYLLKHYQQHMTVDYQNTMLHVICKLSFMESACESIMEEEINGEQTLSNSWTTRFRQNQHHI
jgi:uncharacterized membrane protein YqhA